RGRLLEPLGEEREALLHLRVLAQQAVVRAARDHARVHARVAAPALEVVERDLAAQVGEDEIAVRRLRRREPFGRAREAREPLLGEGATVGVSPRGVVAELVIVRVHAGHRGRDGIERVAVVDERAYELDEEGLYHRGAASLSQGSGTWRERHH